MKRIFTSLLLLTLLQYGFGFNGNLFPFEDCQNASVIFNMNECNANTLSKTHIDFSEFTGTITDNPFVSLNVVDNNLYRINPSQNGHSCTPGVEESAAMCVSYYTGCNYEPDREEAVRFSLELAPKSGLPVRISSLSFFEKSPNMFEWIGGSSGPNDAPTKYGLRIIKNGSVIFEQIDLETNEMWTLQSFLFEDLPDFVVTESTEFTFEIIAYCPTGNSAEVKAWDLDEIKITAVCDNALTMGGTLAGGPFSFCVGDGVPDNIEPGAISLSENSGSNSQWVVTFPDGSIAGLPPTYEAVDFDGAGEGICSVWHLSYEDGLTGLMMGEQLADLAGCFSLSNPIEVNRSQPDGGTLVGGPFSFCVGDGVPDNIEPGAISLSENSGTNSQWVVTFPDGSIAGLPPTYETVDFDGAGQGICSVWHLSYEDGLTGLMMGEQLADLAGCFSLSNPIEVNRSQPVGGTLVGGPFSFCVGDGVPDNIEPGAISLSENSGTNSQWVVTFPDGSIAGLPPTYEAVDFDGAGEGICSVWHLSYEDGLTGLMMGEQVADLAGCFSLSNPIEVNRSQPVGGTLVGGPFSFCVGDGVPDNIEPGAISLSENSGSNSQWVVTFPDGSIAGLPPTYEAVDFDGAGDGICSVWHLSYEDGLTGLMMGEQLADLAGCFSLSNPIEVNRSQPDGGTLVGGPFSFCVGDGVPDNIEPGAISLSENSGSNSQWVVTFPDGSIAGLPPTYEAVDFDGAGDGICSVWHLSYEDGLTGLMMGEQLADLAGCFSLSNPIEVNRSQPDGGTLVGGPFSFCVGDGVPDNIEPGAISLSENSGSNSQWVVTFPDGSIAGLPPTYEAVDFDGAGDGICSVWHLSYEDGLTGLMMGEQLADLAGCFSLSNPIEVNRSQPDGGTLVGGPFSFCVGDGVPDNIEPGAISLSENSGSNSQWVVTFPDGSIAGLPPTYEAVDFDGAGDGICSVWHLSYEDGLTGLMMGEQLADLAGCFSLSNPIEVNRSQPDGGTLVGGPFSFCVGDGVPDNIEPGAISLSENSGSNSQWVVTFPDGSIAGLPPTYEAVDFDGAGEGICSVWHLSYEDGLTGLMMGEQLADLAGCFSLSNPIEVNRSQPDGGTLVGGPFSFCVGDGVPDNIEPGAISLSENSGSNSQWVVTFPDGSIAGLPPTYEAVDFDGAGEGICSVWHLSYEDGLTGLMMGEQLADLAGCFSLSNPIEVNRSQPDGGTLVGGPFSFCVGDGVPDNIEPGAISLSENSGSNSQWVVTFPDGSIAGLPPTYEAVDFDGAGDGICSVWHLSYEDGLTGLMMGEQLADLAGCFSLSNPIEVNRSQPDGGTLVGGPFSFCVGDGVPDNIEPGAISLSENSGSNSQWVVTFPDGSIAGLPPTYEAVDFDSAGDGICSVWHLSYEDGLTGLMMGEQLADLAGCFSLSNPIEVNRSQPVGGTLVGGPFSFCVGDGVPDNIEPGAISLSENSGSNSQWVVTFPDGSIAGLPPTYEAVDFDGAGDGICSVWHLSYEDGLTGLMMGEQLADLAGCFSLSNPIEVNRSQPDGGTLVGGPFSFCVGDGVPDNIEPGAISLSENSGSNSQWVVTFPDGSIAGLPPTYEAVDFDGAGEGICSVWHLSYEDGLTGLMMGEQLADLAGCFSLSNPIEVNRSQPVGGTLVGGPFSFCVGDGVPDNIEPGAISLSENSGSNSQWVVTFPDGSIAGLPPTYEAVDFDGAGDGICSVWHLSYEDGLTGLMMGEQLADLAGCFSLSNPIEVNRSQPDGGTLVGGPFSFCVGDGVPDTIAAGAITLSGNMGDSKWIITNDSGRIMGLPANYDAVNFDGAGVGVCLVWHLSHYGEIVGLTLDSNISNLSGCFDLSDSISVTRNSCPPVSPEQLTIRSYPNPSTDYVKVEINNAYRGKGVVSFFDQYGREVKREEKKSMKSNFKEIFDVSGFNAGIYFISVEINGKISNRRFVKIAGN